MTHGQRRIRGTRGSCASGKVRYRDRAAAILALGRVQANGSPKHTECRAYGCPTCGGWHLTSKP